MTIQSKTPNPLNDRPTTYRVLREDDSPGAEVFHGDKRGVLLHQWNGFAWVLWDGSLVPETMHRTLTWVGVD